MDDTQDTFLPDAADALALEALIPDLITDCPDMYAMAYQVAKDILLQHNITDIEPDKVYWHRFRAAQSSSKTFTGWQHVFEKPRESMTFPQLVIQRFSVHDQDNADLLDADSGFYRADGNAENYDETNEIRLHAKDALKAFWDINFSDRYKTAVTAFWEKHSANFRALAKCTFIAKAIDDYEKGHLTREHFTIVLRAVVGNVNRPFTRQMLMDEVPTGHGLSTRKFCIDHFESTDILSITDDSDLNILYIPGQPRGFYCFNNVEELHQWLVDEVKDAEGRERMLMHFKQEERDILQERPTSLGHKLANFSGIGLIIHAFEETPIDNVGLTHAYDDLPSEHNVADYHLLHYRGEKISGDAFTHLNQSTHERMRSDADFLLHTNGEIRKKLWIGYLNAFNHTFGPMAALAWPAALVVIGAGIANVGLHIDQAINGTTPMERKAAVKAAIFGSVDVLFNLPFLRGAAELAEAAEIAEAAETEEALASGEASKTEVETPTMPSLSVDADATGPSDMDILAPFETNEVLDGDFPVSDEGKFQGIYQPATGGNYIAIDDRFFQVRYSNELQSWTIVDPVNPYSFFRNIPVRLNELGEWTALTRPGLAGGGKFSDLFARAEPSLPDFDAPATAYDVPQDIKPALEQAAKGMAAKGDLKDGFIKLNNPNNELEAFKRLRRTLHDDAVTFYSQPPLRPRPTIPSFIANAKTKDIIKTLFKRSQSLVIGESHSSVGSKQFLIENMSVLRKQKVKTLYMEHLLTDFHQADLDVFNRTGVMSEDLESYLKDLDAGFSTDPSEQFTFEQVVRTAQKNNIRVQAIDCLASYRSTGIAPASIDFRQKMMNFFARQVIGADQTARGAHRWVALVGNSHANTYAGVEGVSELEGSIGLRIESVSPDELGSIKVDPGVADGPGPGYAARFAKNDLLLQIPTPKSVVLAQRLEDGLPRPGTYTLSTSTGEPFLVHRSRTLTNRVITNNGIITRGKLVRTPIKHDANGYYIERDAWQINGRRFQTLDALSSALHRMGMTPVRLPGV
ncbi:membrane-targeted effector domain-containing toxin [Pseudomonas sp. F01002]|uniref:membrane-targeted effector domain-containing toxin n=1 Tax=Pseudomonas sp. F01002 TaxID=2555724 RepID=UPI00106CF8E4|nr:membrane-targeted effector domain-containing toxin [Pseudomonas sp. F01002]TFB44969.1 membrane-targeted effector domain-containing toxin [Pseudomonas sp. F01002]